jgi:predicted transcriptional regulator
MTQARIIKALQNGSLTSHELANLTGMPQATVLSTAKKLRHQGKLTTEIVKVGKSWVAKYTLHDDLIEYKPKKDDEETRCKLNPFDIRNAKGIFTPTEYRVMAAQARRLYVGNPYFTSGITNNQKI